MNGWRQYSYICSHMVNSIDVRYVHVYGWGTYEIQADLIVDTRQYSVPSYLTQK